jgi:hypothetical protein
MTAGKMLSLGIAMLVVGPALANEQKPGVHDSRDRRIEARLNGYEENPTLSTTGRGTFKAIVTKDNEVVYELTYSDLESDVTQAHIHFGRPGINGGIAAWLCGTQGFPGPATFPPPPCEVGREGTVKGTLTADHVIGPSGQGIAAGEFAEFLAAIRGGATYANVHTTVRGGGEIRGIIR